MACWLNAEMGSVSALWAHVQPFLDTPLLVLGDFSLTLGRFLQLLVLFGFLLICSARLQAWIGNQVLPRFGVELGVRSALASITRYLVLFFGSMVLLQILGVDLTSLTLLSSAIGIGIGFGMQSVTSNFVAGLVILMERPIKVGDRIDVGGVEGDVVRIAIRATTIVTNDNIAIIVPNSEFITTRVTNWTLTARTVRITVPVGVAYSSDPEQVRRLLLAVAREHSGVLGRPEPDVLLTEFADNSVNFALRVWTDQYTRIPAVLRSELNFLISAKFREHGIEIPIPQRDIYIRSIAARSVQED